MEIIGYIVLGLIVQFGKNMLQEIENHAAFFTLMSNVVLVGTTIFYAWRTHRMASIMHDQSVPDIVVENVIIKSPLADANIADRLRQSDGIEKFFTNTQGFSLQAIFYTRNKKGGTGSITTPDLVMRSEEHDIEHTLHPGDNSMVRHENEEEAFWKALFLKGGQIKRHDFDYDIHYKTNKWNLTTGHEDVKSRDNFYALLTAVKNDPSLLKYYLSYRDSSGKMQRAPAISITHLHAEV